MNGDGIDFQTSEAPQSDGIDFQPAGPSFGGFAKNLKDDAMTTGKALAGTAKTLVDPGNLWESAAAGSLDPTKRKLSEDWQSLKAIPGALLDEGKRIGGDELLTGHPINAVKKLGGAFYDKPLSTALDFSALLGGEGAAGAAEEAATKAPAIAEEAAAKSNSFVPAAEDARKMSTDMVTSPDRSVATESTPTPGTDSLVQRIASKIPEKVFSPMEEVNKYLQGQYGDLAKKPSFSSTAADYLRRYAQNMSLKNMGAAPRQIIQMGPEAGRAVGKYAMDKGITSPFVGPIGMGEKVAEISKKAGDQIGAIRELADQRGSPPPIEDVLKAVQAKLDPIYTQGVEAGQKGSYLKALQELKRAEPTHQGLADLATTLNHSANAANQLKQASGATTDVANAVRQINHASIAQKLTPTEMTAYEAALKDFGVTKKIQQFLVRKESREAAGRLGPGGGIRHLTQEFLDHMGYKAQARIADRLADVIEKNPERLSTLPSLFKEFIHQIENLGDDSESVH